MAGSCLAVSTICRHSSSFLWLSRFYFFSPSAERAARIASQRLRNVHWQLSEKTASPAIIRRTARGGDTRTYKASIKRQANALKASPRSHTPAAHTLRGEGGDCHFCTLVHQSRLCHPLIVSAVFVGLSHLHSGAFAEALKCKLRHARGAYRTESFTVRVYVLVHPFPPPLF